jgi:hypothetical protein
MRTGWRFETKNIEQGSIRILVAKRGEARKRCWSQSRVGGEGFWIEPYAAQRARSPKPCLQPPRGALGEGWSRDHIGATQSGSLYAGLFICGVTGKKCRSSSTLHESVANAPFPVACWFWAHRQTLRLEEDQLRELPTRYTLSCRRKSQHHLSHLRNLLSLGDA